MSTVIVTLAAPGGLPDALPAQAAEAVRHVAGCGVQAALLAQGWAVDLALEAPAPAQARPLQDALVGALQQLPLAPLDIFVQVVADAGSRRKRLLFADMDATIVVGETLDALAADMGIADRITPITARAMRGEIDFSAALRERVACLRGMPYARLERMAERLRFSTGAEYLLQAMRGAGARCILVSGGFDILTAAVAERLKFDAHYGNSLSFDENGLCRGDVAPPILDRQRKKDILLEEVRRAGLSTKDAAAVGDGANDILMLEAAGLGVAYQAKPAVEAATPHRIRSGDLRSLLFAQGYRLESGRFVPG